MKVIYFFLFLILPQICFAQSIVNQSVKAVMEGDVSMLSRGFDQVVDVTLNNQQTTYSKSQATIVLKNFFSQNAIKSFTVKHKGESPDKSSIYIIGELVPKVGNHYRLYLFFKQKKEHLYLQEIRIEQ